MVVLASFLANSLHYRHFGLFKHYTSHFLIYLIMLIIGVTLGLFTLGSGVITLIELLVRRSAMRRRF